MNDAHQPIATLLQPDTYVLIGWVLMAVLTLVVALWCRHGRRKPKRMWCTLLPLALLWYIFLWGSYVGPRQLDVVHIEYASSDLPPAFDGYKIVHFSDIHTGTFTGWRKPLLRRLVDSINAQQADAVVFTGDLQNKRPYEIYEHKLFLSRIHAKDGVFAVRGNHDFSFYLDSNDPFERQRNDDLTENLPYEMGWTLLVNDRAAIRRDSSYIVISGMDNDGEGRFPQLGDLNAALYHVSRQDFVIMLEHDPTAWRRKILPHSHVQLTLSGHTHGGQFALFGWAPASLKYREIGGLYQAGNRALYVSKGVSGVIPFRFGVNPEITVITLRCKK